MQSARHRTSDRHRPVALRQLNSTGSRGVTPMLELIAGIIIGIGVLGGFGTCLAFAAMMKSGSEEY
ncbi:hypothetical protein GCM10009627_10700 [Curtobacterium herbarum]|uniref:DUF3789 domain-containing protein n=2 Tax=Curtobacterium TaxID=2034 RepID=A0ABP4K1S7_9MICO